MMQHEHRSAQITTRSAGRDPQDKRWMPVLTWSVFIAIVLGICYTRWYHLANGSDVHLSFWEDDFYYYAVIARNIVAHGRSTFDGMTTTNGYHPLWMGVITVLIWIFGGTTPSFFVALTIVSALLALLFFRLLLLLGRELFPGHPALYPLTLGIGAYSTRFLFGGMETTLALPLACMVMLVLVRIGLPERATRKQALLFGFLASLLVLSRLDTLLLIALVASLWLSFFRNWLPSKLLVWMAIGGQLVAYYLIWNLLQFDALTPISGQAKQLTDSSGFSTGMLALVVERWDGITAMGLIPIALVCFLRKGWSARPTGHRLAILSILLFPILFFAVHGLLSDWVLFRWYLYPFPLLFLVGGYCLLTIFFAWMPRKVKRIAPLFALLVVSLAVTGNAWRNMLERTTRWAPDPTWEYFHAKRLLAFTKEHPGIYAMGDRAGTAAFLMQWPVVQLEGLVADRKMLEHIRRQDNLNTVLEEYGVDYLIVSVYHPLPYIDNCYRVMVPHSDQAGERSLKMRGEFCRSPVYSFVAGACSTYVFSTHKPM